MTRGFTLVELLVAMTVTAILGVALTQLLVNDSRFVNRQEAMMDARSAARAAMNRIALDMRLVSDGGVVAAAPESITVRVPYAFGLGCRTVAGRVIASLMPSDSLAYANATPGGVANRLPDGTYDFWDGSPAVVASTDTASCQVDSVRVVTGGRLVEIQAPGPARPDTGQIFYLFQEVTYKFAPSIDLPGRIGLWRRVGSSAPEEIVSPFNSAAQLAFLSGPNLVASDTVPGSLAAIRGLELRLVAESQVAASGDTAPQRFELVTHVAFHNSN
jgi:prepilin-type N-terminal cleavage/methylation domain-containing protein